MSSRKGRINFAAKRKTTTVAIDEIGETITLKALSVGQIITDLKSEDADGPYKQLAAAIINEDGESPYSVDSPEDINELKQMSPSVFKKLVDALNKLHNADEIIDDLKKKSEAMPSTPSASA